jgi:hypothetical protein
LLGLFFDPKDGGDMFLRNVGSLSTDTQRYISEDSTLHGHRCENLNSSMERVIEKLIVAQPLKIFYAFYET